jgi:hypothetical protein
VVSIIFVLGGFQPCPPSLETVKNTVILIITFAMNFTVSSSSA